MLRCLLLASVLLFPSYAWSSLYSNKINFQHVLDNRDVVLGVVLTIHQDSDGYMWFGGENGLVRFDGYELRPFQVIDSSGARKPVSMVVDLFEDSVGMMWVASGNGLLRYDRRVEELRSHPDHVSLAEIPLSTVGVRRVIELESGEIAAATYSGLYLVDRETGEGKLYRASDGISPGRINSVLQVESDYLWVGTASGLDRLHLATGKVEQFRPYSDNPESASDNGVVVMVEASENKLWLGTDNGLILYDSNAQKYVRYQPDPESPNSFSGGDIWDLHLDSKGFLWIATDGGGLNMMDPNAEEFVQFQHEAGRAGSLNSNVVRTVTEDSNGDFWVGNYPGGVNFFDTSSAAIESFFHDPADSNSLSHNSIMSVVADKSGNLWVGTDGAGLNYFDREANRVIRYPFVKDDSSTVSANAVLSMMLDSENILWGGTWAGGIFQVDLNNGNTITRMPNDPKRSEIQAVSYSKKLNNDKVWVMYEDTDGYVWIGTHEGGLSRYDRKTQEYKHYVSTEEKTSLIGNQVWSVFEDSQGTFWVGTTMGLAILNKDTDQFERFQFEEGVEGLISNPSILSLFEDSKKRMWFGTSGGLNLLDRENKTFTAYGVDHGFYNDAIRSIVEDKDGRLWLGTNSGITVFNPDTLKVKNYNRVGGKLVGGFNYNSGLILPSGEAVFGGKKGLRLYHTDKLQDNLVAPPVVLTDFKVLSDSVIIGGADGLLKNSIQFTETLVLDYTDSVIEFGFSALNFRDQNKNRYAYQLVGFDENWVQAGDQRRAKYTNLDAGSYVFHVKGSNNDGVWNDVGKKVNVIQLPPPWQTWWAYTLYSLAVLSAILWFIQAQRKKRRVIEEQNKLLEIKVAERTAELSKKNKDIEGMLTNMHQGLFTIEAEGLIHPEYSKYLEDIFETDKVSGRNVIDLLFSNALLGGDTLNQIQETIMSVVGEDEMNFEFNSHLLIDEYDATIGGNTKSLQMEWNPIVVDDIIEKLMVTVRDITELKKMQAESAAQQKELDIIVQLLNLSAKKYLGFEKASRQFITENRNLLMSSDSRDDRVIEHLFRNMHTIKGNCRTYAFQHMGNIVHETESLYSDLKKSDGTEWPKEQMLSDLEQVEAALTEYGRVYREVLGRDDRSGDRSEGMWLDGKTVREVQEAINLVGTQIPAIKEAASFKPVHALFKKALTSPMEKLLHDIVESLPSIAHQLNKMPPKIEYACSQIRVKDSYQELINNVFAHILRNSVDHGIEPVEDRIAAGKAEEGTIYIEANVVGSDLHLCVSDDGRGLNLQALFEKGVTQGRWQADSAPSAEEVANLLFESGVSTKAEVSDISGRGVGMDAVRQFLQDQNGDIRLHLLSDKTPRSDFVAFQIVISLPENMFVVMEQPVASAQNF